MWLLPLWGSSSAFLGMLKNVSCNNTLVTPQHCCCLHRVGKQKQRVLNVQYLPLYITFPKGSRVPVPDVRGGLCWELLKRNGAGSSPPHRTALGNTWCKNVPHPKEKGEDSPPQSKACSADLSRNLERCFCNRSLLDFSLDL